MAVTSVVLRDPAHRVARRAPLMWAAGGLVRSGVGVGLLLLVSDAWHWFPMPAAAWVGYAVVAACYCVAMPVLRYRLHRWETSAGAVYTQTGWLARERRVAPMSRVQTVDVSQDPISRLLGLATVTVTTASSRGPLQIAGLARPVADDLVAELARRAEALVGDAT
ncbi:MAG TPA: PH domain-containing protein [Nakamurella sp.]|nr:PH domain-containing protein [Nakamurella sp.]